ncbi:MAG: hypothetical protein L3J98_17560 [Gammaproteobacteria bacterium]|nr:hypothetical protein [Gammaproteobacteria bacterium]
MMDFKQIQQFYGIVGAAFLPLLAVALLIMNSSRACLGQYRNNWPSQILLSTTVVFFLGMAWMKWSA